MIVYELNEVPWRVLDIYIQRRPDSHFARLVDTARTFTTVTADAGELHPWTTWPSAHRGVFNTEHDIRFINQQIDDRFPPVWALLAEAGIDVGVFGSLQAHALWPDDTKHYSFYVPDTFAPDARTHPRRYEAFQRFNLRMTQRDGAGAQRLPVGPSVVADLAAMAGTGLRGRTVAQLVKHVVSEQTQPLYKTRRPVMQAPLAFDFFFDALARYKPQFATVFTNHVAGIMHRYWKYSFPEDFQYDMDGEDDEFRAESLMVAMDIADQQLGVMLDHAEATGAVVVVMSSMGQEAVQRDPYAGEFRIADAKAFLGALGLSDGITQKLAMQPDFVFACDSSEIREELLARVASVVDESGQPLFSVKVTDLAVNLNLKPSRRCLEDRVVYRPAEGKSQPKPFEIGALGIQFIERDPGTGYHQPKGIALFRGPTIVPDPSRTEVSLARICPTILGHFGVPTRPYMADPLPLA